MNEDRLKGNWKQIKGKVKTKWGQLTDDEVSQINGERDRLVGTIQEKYGLAKDEAEKQVQEFEKSWD